MGDLASVVQLILGWTLAITAAGHLARPDGVIASLAPYEAIGLDRRWVAISVSLLQFVVGLLLLLGGAAYLRVGSLLAVALLLAYSMHVRRLLSLDESVSCGCAIGEHDRPVSNWDLARSGILASLAIGLALSIFQEQVANPRLGHHLTALIAAAAFWNLPDATSTLEAEFA